MSTWKTITLGDAVEIKHGWPFKSEFFIEDAPGKPVVVSIGNFRYSGGFRFNETNLKFYNSEYPSEYILSPGDILLVMTCQTAGGEIIGIPGKIPSDGSIYLHNQRLGKVIFHQPDLLDKHFAYWLFLSPSFNQELVRTASGSKILHTSPSRIQDFKTSVPPVVEQRAIAHVLDSLDDKIELNRQMNETLEEMARTLFHSWFVDFDPVHAKAEGRQPEGMDAETAALFPSEFVESELGMIPKEWVMATINDVAAINARTLSKNDTLDRIRYIEISEVQRGEIGSIAEYERGQEPSRARRRLQHGDTAMSTVRPDRGAYFLAHHPEEDLIASTGFAVLTPQTVPWAFLFLSLTQPEVFTYLGHIADGGAYPAINPGAIGDLRLVLPDATILKAFSDLVTPILEQMEEARQENRGLATLRDDLLPKLVSGEVRLPEDLIAEFEK